MSDTSTKLDWILFIVFFILMWIMLLSPVLRGWFWVTLPFAGTYLLKALRMM